jgi:hypothetical protein
VGGSLIIYAQIAIIAAGNTTETIGEVFPIMQTIAKKDVPLNVPKFEVPIEQPIVKKKLTFWQRILKMFGL